VRKRTVSHPLSLTRRDALKTAACGFGYLAMTGLSAHAAAAR
jgi:hypothetical protein